MAQGNITAIARDSSGAALATHTVFTSGPAAGIVLSLDAPSVSTGTGAALLLNGQDAGLVRATIVPALPNIILLVHTERCSFGILYMYCCECC